jgi:cytochrome c biogenesis protein CcdA
VRSDIAFAVSAGMLAAFNPCGFALLPTYLAIFVGTPSSRSSATARAVVVGGSVTAGFVAVFGAVGAALVLLSVSLGPWLSVVTLVSGVALIGVGAWLVSGRDLAVRLPRARLSVSGSVPGMVAYGVVYASVSLSCTLPVFLAAVVYVFGAPGSGPVAGGLAALAYAVGMGAVLTTLAVVVALVGQAAAARVRSWTRYVGRASGVLVALAGAYVVWYGWVELVTLNGGTTAAGPVGWVSAASGRASQVVADLGPTRLLSSLVGIALIALTVGRLSQRRRR